jgi:subtilisin family serine protease
MSRSPARLAGARLLAVAAVALIPLAGLAVPASAAPGVPPPGPRTVAGAWIVTLEPGASSERVANAHALRHGARVDHVYGHAVRGYAARMSDQKAARIAQDPRVASVERDEVVTLDAQSIPTGIDRIDGEVSSAVAGNGSGAVDVDVAVLDTGIAAHPDLNVVGGRNCTTGSKTAYTDRHGHGTHVAGTIAAKDDSNGVVGVAPGARLWAVKVLNDQGSGTRSGIICGIDWVTAKGGIEVANMSLGGSGTEPTGTTCSTGDAYHDAICRSVTSGVTYAVAAGNSATDSANHVPAAYDEVITVSALADFNGVAGGGAAATCRADVDDTFADFSNFGLDVDLIAPGVCITSTWPGGGYNTISGTSMASPHVAGAAALYKAGKPGATPAQVKSALQAAGNFAWDDAQDPDPVQEPLLGVAGF